MSVQRVLVAREVYEPFLELLTPKVRALVAGDPADEATDMGPLIDRDNHDRVPAWIAEATDGGARVLAGAHAEGAVVQPTLLADVDPTMPLASETALAGVTRLQFGSVLINEASEFRADQMPYGGINASGNTKEGPAASILEFTDERLVVIAAPGLRL